MTTDQLVNIALAIGTPILTALLGIFALVVGDWRQRRTEAGRRELAIEDASKHVAFAAEWWNAWKLIADSPEAEQQATTRALAWLEDASTLVAESQSPPVDAEPTITLHRLLLIYPFDSRVAMFFRGTFYFCLGLVPFLVGDAIHSALDPERRGVTNYLTGRHFYVDVISVATLMVVAMALRFCAQRAEASRHSDVERGPLTLRRALLFYAFARPAARIVRIIFYIWTVFAIVLAIGLISDVIDEPRAVVSGAVEFVGIIGYALALRYWAISLEARAKGRVSSKSSSATTVESQPG